MCHQFVTDTQKQITHTHQKKYMLDDVLQVNSDFFFFFFVQEEKSYTTDGEGNWQFRQLKPRGTRGSACMGFPAHAMEGTQGRMEPLNHYGKNKPSSGEIRRKGK